MFSLHRTQDRCHELHARFERWQTFPEGTPGFAGLLGIEEGWLGRGGSLSYSSAFVLENAETISYTIEGTVTLDDLEGHSGLLRAGEFQRRTVGRHSRHAERNASQSDRARLVRLSLRPLAASRGAHAPERRLFSVAERRGVLCLVASPDGRRDSLAIAADAQLFSSFLAVGQHVIHELVGGRRSWLQVLAGEVSSADLVVGAGDGLAISGERCVSLTAQEETELLLLDLAA